ncbi:CwfJ domain-containing protein [Cordyceps javanica]|uniref:CwfJ domain-containing protein n=1 Tax=Cordyceps javanica TaxID=43265 RepID=A0A545V1R0_9HYPO|nr:CwfJ domain-containing protein [Cordyceps javanica]TQW07148.1 CwfJ domain protein [Cordyceps javanica]
MAAPKIIVVGSLNGNLEPAFKKLAALHAKNSFALALLTGDVFAPADSDDADADAALDALLAGTLAVPLPTYFTVGSRALPARIVAKIAAADEEICPNLHFLGRRSVTKTAEGLRIVALGGAPANGGAAAAADADAETSGTEQYLPFHTEEDAKSLKGAHSADILLTPAAWPAGIWGGGSKVALDDAHRGQVAASRPVAELCAALRPRYHLSASPGPFFYEREPFVQAAAGADSKSHAGDVAAVSVTRFIAMAPYGNAAKQKALYAFSLNKTDESVPPGATASPLVAQRDRKRPRNDDSHDTYSRYGHGHQHNQNRHRPRQPPPGPDQCFFCLSNPQTATHMVCSIGDDAYITTAKGPLPLPPSSATTRSSSPPSTSTTTATAITNPSDHLGFPGHFIIIPLPHAPTISALPGGNSSSSGDPSGEAAKARREMARFREALQAMIAARSRRRLGAVTWEISRARNVHLIWQLVAVPAGLVARGLAEAALRVEADRHQYPAFQTRDFASPEEEAGFGDYVRVWLWCDGDGDGDGDGGGNDDQVNDDDDKDKDKERLHGTTLVMPLPDPDMRFDLQFARRALAKLLGLDRRAVWQECQQTEEEETRDAEAFREAFKEWDFTLES